MNLKQKLEQCNLKLNQYLTICTECKSMVQIKFVDVHFEKCKPYCYHCKRKLVGKWVMEKRINK